MKYSSEGIILSRKNYGEADRILTVLSSNYGKKTFLAKRIRKLASKKRGHLEIFSKIKFSAVSGNGFDILTEADTVSNYTKIRSDLNRVSLAYYFCEVVNKITKEDEIHKNLFLLLDDYLVNLQTSINLKTLRKEFVKKLLIEMGYWPTNKLMTDHDIELEGVLERKISSLRVGKKVLA